MGLDFAGCLMGFWADQFWCLHVGSLMTASIACAKTSQPSGIRSQPHLTVISVSRHPLGVRPFILSPTSFHRQSILFFISSHPPPRFVWLPAHRDEGPRATFANLLLLSRHPASRTPSRPPQPFAAAISPFSARRLPAAQPALCVNLLAGLPRCRCRPDRVP